MQCVMKHLPRWFVGLVLVATGTGEALDIRRPGQMVGHRGVDIGAELGEAQLLLTRSEVPPLLNQHPDPFLQPRAAFGQSKPSFP